MTRTGPGAIFSVTKRNIFEEGETFGVSMRGSYEWQTGKRVSGNSFGDQQLGVRYQRYADFPAGTFPQFDKA